MTSILPNYQLSRRGGNFGGFTIIISANYDDRKDGIGNEREIILTTDDDDDINNDNNYDMSSRNDRHRIMHYHPWLTVQIWP